MDFFYKKVKKKKHMAKGYVRCDCEEEGFGCF